MMMKHIRLVLAAMMLLCLAPMPYGYFQLVRFLATLAFGVMTYRYYQERKEGLAYTFGALTLLFQPFYKIVLGRAMWNAVDVAVAVGLVGLFFYEQRKERDAEKRKEENGPKRRPDITPVTVTAKSARDNRVEFTLQGKLGPKELVYVASEEDKGLAELFESQPEVIEGWGKMIGFRIIYLPLLMRRLRDKRVLQYRAPYLGDAELRNITIGNDFMLQYLAHAGDKQKLKHGFIRTEDIHRGDDGKDKATNRFYPLSSESGEPIADQLHRIGRQITEEQIGCEKRIDEGVNYASCRDVSDAESLFNSQAEQENIDDLLEEVRERIALLRQRGVSQYILEQLIHPDDRLSRLVITKDYRILLPDYQEMEIKLEPLAKAVYLLFLKHPEGIMFKNLPNYRKELSEIYGKLRPAGLTDRARQSIDDVTNPLLNSINEKCARIRGAFVGQFDDHMARHYYIDGRRGEVKRIALPRNLVVWEQ